MADHDHPDNLIEAAERGVKLAEEALSNNPTNKVLQAELETRKSNLERVKNPT